MLTVSATHAKATNALMDIGVAAFPSLSCVTHRPASDDIDGDVDRFVDIVCGASDCASDLMERHCAALLFPNVAGAPLKSRHSDGVVRVGASSVAYYHLVTPPSLRRAEPFGLAIFFPEEPAAHWQDYRIPYGRSGLVVSLGLEGAQLLRLRPLH
jgi:hypothetical protein